MSEELEQARRQKLLLSYGMEGELFSRYYFRSGYASSASLPSQYQRRIMWSGIFGLFMKNTAPTSTKNRSEKEKGEGTKISFVQTAVIFHTTNFKSESRHRSIVPNKSRHR